MYSFVMRKQLDTFEINFRTHKWGKYAYGALSGMFNLLGTRTPHLASKLDRELNENDYIDGDGLWDDSPFIICVCLQGLRLQL